MSDKSESDYYDPVRDALAGEFEDRVGDDFHLEVTAPGKYSETVQEHIPRGRELVYEVIQRGSSPDITGFVKRDHRADFVVVEIKPDRLSNLKAIYQCQRYVDVFGAKHGFVVTPERIPSKIKRFCEQEGILYQDSIYEHLTLCEFDEESGQTVDWYEDNPFDVDRYWS